MQIEIRQIHKHFGKVRANENINLSFRAGRIVGILGENGAGKSTLMKILAGYQAADSGEIWLDGKFAQYHNPLGALAQGIGMLQQDPLDVPAFTVLENFSYGQRGQGHWLYRRSQAERDFRAIAERFGFQIEPRARITDLSIAQRQQLEILRLLAQDIRTLILDEPTTGISEEQKDLLFATLRKLASDGMTILLVSHKLEDVLNLCDEVAVLRAGRVVGQRDLPASKADLVALMFGHDIDASPRPEQDFSGVPIALELRDVHVQAGRIHIQNFNLAVRQGEIIGFAGLDGSGQDVLMRTCARLVDPLEGKVFLNGDLMNQEHYHEALARGLFFTAAGRLEEGLIQGLTIKEHVALLEEKSLWVNWQTAQTRSQAKIAEYWVKGTPDSPIETLSGGNQQRVLLSLMPASPQVLILEQPMRGLDLDSALAIWQKLLARVAQGTALLFTSPDLDELIRYSDRIVVCYAGKTQIIEHPHDLSLQALGHFIGGEFDYQY